MEIFEFCVITFEPIFSKTCYAPQNDRRNLSFVKDKHVVGKNGQIWSKIDYLSVATFWEFAELVRSLRIHLRP